MNLEAVSIHIRTKLVLNLALGQLFLYDFSELV